MRHVEKGRAGGRAGNTWTYFKKMRFYAGIIIYSTVIVREAFSDKHSGSSRKVSI